MDAEEAILGALSPEEIACLVDQLEEIDPENELLPAGMFEYEKFAFRWFLARFLFSSQKTPEGFLIAYRCSFQIIILLSRLQTIESNGQETNGRI